MKCVYKIGLAFFLVVILSISCIACGPDNEELIKERITSFACAYNDGDMDTVLNSLDTETRSTLEAMLNLYNSLLGGLTGFNFDLRDLFTLGVNMTAGDMMELRIEEILVKDQENAIVVAVMDLGDSGEQTVYFIMVYENKGWYIHDITDDREELPEGDELLEDNKGNDIQIDVDTSFLTQTTPSSGLTFKLSNDKTYYILTDMGSCTDEHVVIPEYPSEYNPIPVKRIECVFKGASYVTYPVSVTWAYSPASSVKAINYLGSLSDFCQIEFSVPSSWTNSSGFQDKVIYCNGNVLSGALIVPSDVERIANNAFYEYDKITSVSIKGATDIGENAFRNCSLLQRVTIGNERLHIYHYAFYGCSRLESIVIGDNVEGIGYAAFSNTAYVNAESNWEKGVLYLGKYLLSAKADIINLTVKEGTVGIQQQALYEHSNLTNLILPLSLRWIGSSSISQCKSLDSVAFSGSEEEYVSRTNGNETLLVTDNIILIFKKGSYYANVETCEILNYNGHRYMIFGGCDWLSAQEICESLGGYLATLTDENENMAVYNFMKSQSISGAYFGMLDPEKDGVWEWVTGEAFEYSNWAVNEPNGRDEYYGAFDKQYNLGQWNDINGGSTGYFVCEWGEYVVDSAS